MSLIVTIQTELTPTNLDMVTWELSNVVQQANETEDQSKENLEAVSLILSKTARVGLNATVSLNLIEKND